MFVSGLSVKQPPPSARIPEDAAEHEPGGQRWRSEMRLRSPLEFARVRREGRRVSGPLLTLAYTRRPAPAGGTPDAAALAADMVLPTRIGLSVSKRVGDAVRRNRVKRWLRESIRRGYAELAPGWDIIVSARTGAAAAGYNTVDAETRGLIARAKLRRASVDRG